MNDEIEKKLVQFDEKYKDFKKEQIKQKTKRYYDKHIGNNYITIFCDYCKEYHTILRVSYDQNIERNNEYICPNKSASIITPAKIAQHEKARKINEYAEESKKQCTLCQEIKSLNDFGKDTSRRDGYASRCKACRSKVELNKYYTKKEKGEKNENNI